MREGRRLCEGRGECQGHLWGSGVGVARDLILGGWFGDGRRGEGLG